MDHLRSSRFADYSAAMHSAMKLAHEAAVGGDVPIGALVLDPDGKVLGRGYNRREQDGDPTAHAEIIALRQAGQRRGDWRLADCTLVVTLEPCTMCAGAIVLSRIKTVVFGAWDEKAGAAGSLRDVLRDTRMNHNPQVIAGVLEEAAKTQLASYFRGLRQIENP